MDEDSYVRARSEFTPTIVREGRLGPTQNETCITYNIFRSTGSFFPRYYEL